MRIIKGLREGQEPAAIATWFVRERARIRAEQEEKNRTQPEPKDKLSGEWRYWKLRRMERALRGQEGEKAQRAARREFKRIAREAINVAISDRYHAEMMLPHFIIAIQQKGGAQG
jgi:alkylhydroperoxidase family enzyme